MKKLITMLVMLALIGLSFFANAQVPSYVPSNGLVAYYPFNGNANDESGNGNNGTVNGAILTTDRFGNANSAYSFSSSYINIPNSSSLQFNNQISISVWVYAFSLPDVSYILSKGSDGVTPYSWTFLLNSSGGGGFDSWDGGSGSPRGTCCGVGNITPIMTNQWTNITITLNGTSGDLYLNGVLNNSSPCSHTIFSNIYDLKFGRMGHPTGNWPYYWDGKLDDIGIWNRVLTASEITALYQGGDDLSKGLVAMYPFNGNANDESGNGNNGTVNGATLTTDRFGNANSAYSFNGTTDYILVANSILPYTPSSCSFSFWFNSSDNDACFLSDRGSGINYAKYQIMISSNKVSSNSYSSSCNSTPVQSNYDYNVWNHVVVVKDNIQNSEYLYINGVLVSTVNSLCYWSTNNSTSIGRRSGSANDAYYNGILDDIGIWNRALTQSEVTALYQGSCSAPLPVASGATLNSGQTTTLTATGGTNYKWYDAAQGGNLLSTSASFTTPALTQTTIFYVSNTTTCESARVAVTVIVSTSTCKTQAPNVTGASRCGTGSVTLQASGGKSYLWYNAASGGNIVNVGPVFNTPALKVPTTYYVTNFDSCESARVPVFAQINILSIGAGSDQSIACGNSAALNTTTSYNGSQNLTYSWTPTTGLSSSSIASPIASPGQTTKYTVMVSDGVCSAFDNVTVGVAPQKLGVDFSTNLQLIYQPPFAIQFNNLTPNLSDYNFTWYFGDGISDQSNNSVEFHQYAQNGTYDVTLIASGKSTGCSDTLYKKGWIFCAGGTTCPQSASISQLSPINGCTGTPVVLTCNTVAGATYQWNYNGVTIANSNNNVYYANASGNYSVTIILNNCPVTSSVVTVLLNNSLSVPTITQTGNLTYCGGGSVTLMTTATANSYAWSNGGSGQNITVTTAGIYTVKIIDNNGCSSQSLPLLVGASPVSNPDICIVTLNDNGKNEIVWNKPVTKAIKQFNIYSQGNQANVFNLIGTVPYASLSVFTDSASVPAQQSYLYQISAVDTCESESQLSAVHQTIHLSINQGMGTTWNLIWNYYQGFTFPSYNIYRGTDPTSMTLLTTIASTLNSFTDLTPPTGYVYYQIEAVNPNPCNPTKSGKYGSTKSNIASNNLSMGVNELGIRN